MLQLCAQGAPDAAVQRHAAQVGQQGGAPVPGESAAGGFAESAPCPCCSVLWL